MSDLMNYVYVPAWVLILLSGMSFVGFEYLVSRAIRQIDRWTRPRIVTKPEKQAEIVLLHEHREAK